MPTTATMTPSAITLSTCHTTTDEAIASTVLLCREPCRSVPGIKELTRCQPPSVCQDDSSRGAGIYDQQPALCGQT